MPGALYTICTHVGAPTRPIPRTDTYSRPQEPDSSQSRRRKHRPRCFLQRRRLRAEHLAQPRRAPPDTETHHRLGGHPGREPGYASQALEIGLIRGAVVYRRALASSCILSIMLGMISGMVMS